MSGQALGSFSASREALPFRRLLLLLLLGAFALAGCSQGDTAGSAASTDGSPADKGLPRLVDLGADQCIPCKMMAPILEELERDYAGRMRVDFIDVWKNPDLAGPYNVQMIPTQIFYGPDGEELFRHVGFIGKEDILAKWRELGHDFGS